MKDLMAEFRWRGFLAQTTSEDLDRYLLEARRTLYVGFDPTAASLHLGSLIPIMGLAHAQRAGHRPIVLVGGGTGLIGDPSGKTSERALLTPEQVQANCEGMRKQLARFLDFSPPQGALLLNNADWLCSLKLIDFLRDIGKHFSVNEMVKRDSVRIRLEGRDQGISYTEFSYMLLQAYDFLHLCREYDCTIQMGGSDQWGNIVSGADLVRRMLRRRAEGITFPLLTTSTGKKFGKSEEGAVYLDENLTSPYQLYQYWIQTADADVIAYLKLFTFLDPAQIQELAAITREKPEERTAQKVLAAECTRMVHGEQALRAVEQASRLLFGSADLVPDEATLELLAREVPSSTVSRAELEAGLALPDLLTRTRIAESKGAARKLIEGGGFYLNNKRVDATRKTVTAADMEWPGAILLRSGKKTYHLLRVL
ncbi:MAG: tyrosine--tRNA ligase [Bryobacteraceae bacterium]|nr:tyrosine--tRNA ligase [Bryobacteraceae bacterium]MDW8379268.1 tyrosine--tRNA ligase [Bryobacterales bacterium]